MDKKSLEFHIKSNDYFGTLATVLDILKQQIFKDSSSSNNNNNNKTMKNKIVELMYLQKNYKIVKNLKLNKYKY